MRMVTKLIKIIGEGLLAPSPWEGCDRLCDSREGFSHYVISYKPLPTPFRWEGIAQPLHF